ncbi:hypothetical protein RFI_05417 [Reticulomyxa filosa]|uniref:Transmembrane protein n=1 Tax=Reticulomyxa filosa TaxID=46433 RepID=X6P0U6_RETFI|nr:hypothetical protein RFI_05417 [Reticulomyxa filosa]|eukprot:ETO31704.1 hypothetical protein RFI_05417 [Reticulomyxa filosa]
MQKRRQNTGMTSSQQFHQPQQPTFGSSVQLQPLPATYMPITSTAKTVHSSTGNSYHIYQPTDGSVVTSLPSQTAFVALSAHQVANSSGTVSIPISANPPMAISSIPTGSGTTMAIPKRKKVIFIYIDLVIICVCLLLTAIGVYIQYHRTSDPNEPFSFFYLDALSPSSLKQFLRTDHSIQPRTIPVSLVYVVWFVVLCMVIILEYAFTHAAVPRYIRLYKILFDIELFVLTGLIVYTSLVIIQAFSCEKKPNFGHNNNVVNRINSFPCGQSAMAFLPFFLFLYVMDILMQHWYEEELPSIVAMGAGVTEEMKQWHSQLRQLSIQNKNKQVLSIVLMQFILFSLSTILWQVIPYPVCCSKKKKKTSHIFNNNNKNTYVIITGVILDIVVLWFVQPLLFRNYFLKFNDDSILLKLPIQEYLFPHNYMNIPNKWLFMYKFSLCCLCGCCCSWYCQNFNMKNGNNGMRINAGNLLWTNYEGYYSSSIASSDTYHINLVNSNASMCQFISVLKLIWEWLVDRYADFLQANEDKNLPNRGCSHLYFTIYHYKWPFHTHSQHSYGMSLQPTMWIPASDIVLPNHSIKDSQNLMPQTAFHPERQSNDFDEEEKMGELYDQDSQKDVPLPLTATSPGSFV